MEWLANRSLIDHGNTGMLATDLLGRIPKAIATLRA